MRRIAFTTLAALLPLTLTSVPASAGGLEYVIELYTSQGCSSCPPADALIQTFVERPDVLALTFNVDYWDYLGWKDTLASERHTKRQKAYAKARGDGSVYTPQVVINGMGHLVGSDRARIEAVLKSQGSALSGSGMVVRMVREGERIVVQTSGSGKISEPLTVWVMSVSPRVDVQIPRGENKGLSATYRNVVRDIKAVGMVSNNEQRLELPAASVMRQPEDRSAVILQRGMVGPIVAAAWMQ